MRFKTRQQVKTPGTMYMCADGPWFGEKLYLTTSSTAVFTVKGVTGRYINMGNGSLRWEPHNV